MNKLKLISGLTYMVLGVIGIIVILFEASPAVSTLFLVLGLIGFAVLGTYGTKTVLEAWLKSEVDFQVNS